MTRRVQLSQTLRNQARLEFRFGHVLFFLIVNRLLLFNEAQVDIDTGSGWFRTF